MKKIRVNKLLYILLFIFQTTYSQESTDDNLIYEGNKKVKKEDFNGAEIDYRNALFNDPKSPKAFHNLGNAQYNSSAYEEAIQQFFRTQKFSKDKLEKHSAFHNMGNTFMKKKQYEKAVESYKSALRNNPSDDETRYNYALAKSLLDKQKNNDNKGDKKNDDQKQNESPENNDKKSEKGDNKKDSENDEQRNDDRAKDDNKKNKNSKSDKNESDNKKNNKPSQGKLSPEQVKSLLEAMNNQEKKVQDKINAKKVKGAPIKSKKDW